MGKVLLAGAFGQGNPGDEALLEAFMRALDGHRVVATSMTPQATEVEHGCRTVAPSPGAVAREVLTCDAVVYAGGTIFKELHPSARRPSLDLLRRAVGLALLTRSLGKPLALVGVGVGRLESPAARRLARRLVALADLLVLRDEESAHALARVGAPVPLRVGADPGWTSLGASRSFPSEVDDTMGVALSHLAEGPRGPSLLPWLVGVLEPVLAAGFRVEVHAWQPPSDTLLGAELVARLGAGAALVASPRDLPHARESFSGQRAMLGLRLHALIAAASAGTPFVALAHEPKLQAVARVCGQATVETSTPPAVAAGALLAAGESPGVSADAVRAQSVAAEAGFDLLRLLLSPDPMADMPHERTLALEPRPWR